MTKPVVNDAGKNNRRGARLQRLLVKRRYNGVLNLNRNISGNFSDQRLSRNRLEITSSSRGPGFG